MMSFSDNPISYLSRMMWKFSQGNRSKLVLALCMFTIANSIYFVEPLIIAKVLNIIQVEGVTSTNIGLILLILSSYLFINIGFWIFHGPARVLEITNAFIVRAQYKQYLLEGTMDLPAKWHTNHHSGDTIDKIEKGTQALYSFSSEYFLIVESVIKLIGSYIALTYFNVHSAYIVIIMFTLTLYIIYKFDQHLIRQLKTLNEAENKISSKVFDTLSNITTVIILRIENLVSKAIYQKIMYPFKLFRKNNKLNETKWFIVGFCGATMTFLVLSTYVYSSLVSGQIVLVGTIYALYGYVDRISNLFYRFAYKYGAIVRNRTDVANAEEISKEFTKRQKRAKRIHDWKKLEIKKLKFSYHGEDFDAHLNIKNMTILRNQRIALIGESGSGKTTFLKVFRDLYSADKHEIYLDSKRFKHGFKSLSNDVTLIPQDPEIFSSTMKENITFGAKIPMKLVTKYSKIAEFEKVAQNLPHKYESTMVERGVSLSGGQKQRLALTRGLLASKDKSIVLLDEPTSSVDSQNELKIYKSVFKEFKNKTIISSIHRLHLLKLFDIVYYFKDGKIIASGTFEELLKNSEDFKRMYKDYKASKED